MAPARNALSLGSSGRGWRLTPLHTSESTCGRGACMLGRGGSAGVVNQAAERSEPASSQHQGSSAPLPSHFHHNSHGGYFSILHWKSPTSTCGVVHCSFHGILSNEYVSMVKILIITDYLIPLKKKRQKENHFCWFCYAYFVFLFLPYNKYLKYFNRLVLFYL